MPYVALGIWGKGGAIAVLLMVFMAVTSAFSSETMACSAWMSHDVYKAYINKDAVSSQLVRVSRVSIVVFASLVALIAIAFNHAGFSVSALASTMSRRVALLIFIFRFRSTFL